MTTLGVTFPEADDSVMYAVRKMNSAIELGRKTACLPSGGREGDASDDFVPYR